MNPQENHIYSATHHDHRLYIHFPPSDRHQVGNCVKSVRSIEVQHHGQSIMIVEDLGVQLYGRYGDFSSNLACNGMNELVLCGDFIFVVHIAGGESKWSHHIASQNITRLHIIDRPTNETRVNLNQGYAYMNSRPKFPTPPVQLIRSGGSIAMPKGLGTELYQYLDTLFEIQKTNRKRLFSPYGSFRDGAFHLHQPMQFDSCNGAARIHYTEEGFRWIFADKEGCYTWAALQQVLESTNDRDDWNTLKEHYISGASQQERQAVIRHFHDIGDETLLAEVMATLG